MAKHKQRKQQIRRHSSVLEISESSCPVAFNVSIAASTRCHEARDYFMALLLSSVSSLTFSLCWLGFGSSDNERERR